MCTLGLTIMSAFHPKCHAPGILGVCCAKMGTVKSWLRFSALDFPLPRTWRFKNEPFQSPLHGPSTATE